MAEILHVKSKSTWKNVDINTNLFSKTDLDGFISLEELTDYNLVTSNEKKTQKKQNNKETPAENPKGDTTDSTKQEKKRRNKRKKKKKADESRTAKLEKSGVGPNKISSKEVKIKKTIAVKKGLISGKNNVIEDLNAVMEAETKVEQKAHSQNRKRKRKNGNPNESQNKKAKVDIAIMEETAKISEEDLVTKSTKGMEAWYNLYVPDEVLWALKDQGFYEPTPIQAQVLGSAIRDQMDILGAAETGSGKTLAFGIPVLHYILQNRIQAASPEPNTDEDTILPETEDLESDEDGEAEGSSVGEATDDEEEEDGDDHGNSSEEEIGDLHEDGTGCVKVIKDVDFSWLEAAMRPIQTTPPVVKKMKTHPLALILEPTRELAVQVKNHLMAAAKYTDIKIAVIVGGLALQKQRRILKKCPDIVVATPGRLWELIQEGEMYLSEIEKTQHLVVDEADRMIEKGHFEELSKLLLRMNRDPKVREKRHTYVFSATLTLLHSGPQRLLKKKKKIILDGNQKLETLMQSIGLKMKPKVVDITRKVGTVETLTEARINCTKEEKDIYLYYFLKQYPGRTLVFTNSKDCIRRLLSIFTLLQFNVLPLHADMHQKQRLKNLERFTANPRGLLLASDVAARGLDIPNVQHVIHYQVPHTVENYVHRSGRTARAFKEGLSVMIIGPEDLKNYKKIIHTLNKNEDLPMFPVEQEYLTEIRHRVGIVRQIETQEYRFKKTKRQNDWFQKAAEEVGVDIEDEGLNPLLNDLGDDSEQAQHKQYIKQMRTELAVLMKQPLLPRAVGGKYPTKSGRLLAIPSRDTESNAILHVKKDKKVQDKMIEKSLKKPRPVKPVKKKKDKWKKKKRKDKF